MYSFQEPFHIKFKLVDLWHHCCEGLERSNLALVDVHRFSTGSTDTWIMIIFSLQGPERSEVMLANVIILQKTVSYHTGTVTMTFQNFGTTHSQNSASLGTSVSSMVNSILSLADLTESPCQPCHTFPHHCGSTPAKSCHFIIKALNKSYTLVA